MTAGNDCTVRIEIDPQGCEEAFLSPAMYDLLEGKVSEYADRVSQRAASHLHGPMPSTGLFGYRMKRGRKTWIAVIHPNNKAAYNIGRKYGTKNL